MLWIIMVTLKSQLILRKVKVVEKLKDSWLVEKETQEFGNPRKKWLRANLPGWPSYRGRSPDSHPCVVGWVWGRGLPLLLSCGCCSLPATLFVIVSVLQFLVVLFLSFCLFYYFLSATVVCWPFLSFNKARIGVGAYVFACSISFAFFFTALRSLSPPERFLQFPLLPGTPLSFQHCSSTASVVWQVADWCCSIRFSLLHQFRVSCLVSLCVGAGCDFGGRCRCTFLLAASPCVLFSLFGWLVRPSSLVATGEVTFVFFFLLLVRSGWLSSWLGIVCRPFCFGLPFFWHSLSSLWVLGASLFSGRSRRGNFGSLFCFFLCWFLLLGLSWCASFLAFLLVLSWV